MRNIFSFLLPALLFFSSILPAQEIGIGQWRDHLPYYSGKSVAVADNKVYCATEYSMFYYNRDDNSIQRITTVNGLSDVGIGTIGFSDVQKTLIVAYSNTNIDLIKGNTIINMPDILESNAITPEEKTIHNIYFEGNLAYLSCGYGISVLDLENEEIKDTYFIGPDGTHLRVYGITMNDTAVIAATEEGIYFADRNSANLAYYESWGKMQNLPYPDAVYNQIAFHSDRIFVNKYSSEWNNDTILYLENGAWVSDTLFSTDDVQSLRVFDETLYVLHNYNVKGYNADLEEEMVIWTYNGNTGPNPLEISVDNSGMIWLADRWSGLVQMFDGFNAEIIYPDGPVSANVYAMASSGPEVWTVPGGKNNSWGNLYIPGSLSHFNDGDWINLNRNNVEALDSIPDVLTIAIDPFDSKRVFAGSWLKGVLEFYDHQLVNIYNHENSSLQKHPQWEEDVVKVAGMDFDSQGNLWMSNTGVNDVLSVRQPDGSPEGAWQSFYLGSGTIAKDIGQVIVDAWAQKWILMRQDHSIVVFSDNNTISDPSDDRYKMLSSAQGNGNIPGNKVYSIEEDLDDEIWIGTDAGVAVFYSPENVFTNFDFDAQQILIPKNDGSGLADILFEFETITAIEVDGSNRKWIGTDRSGVFLISDNGQEEIYHFTTENSPLLSNSITSLTLNHTTGEIFIGTAKGLISFKGTATMGGATNNDVYAYPNPVRPGFNGPIAIRGLVKNADVKITDISGNLVYKTRAEGGQAIWDGRSFDGSKARSGVYMVFVTSDDGTETYVTKILFMN